MEKPNYTQTVSYKTFMKGMLIGGIVATLVFFFAIQTPATDSVEALNSANVVEVTEFTMGTRLGPNQVEEHIEVFVNDEFVGILHITEDKPISSLSITVDEPGLHEYRMNSVTRVRATDGTVISFTGYGTGTMDIQDGDHFSAYYSDHTRIWTMSFLEE